MKIETLNDIILYAILIAVLYIIGFVLRSNKKRILASITQLVQQAEGAIRGSGMGEEKKALVIAQLTAMGVKVTAWVDKTIDSVVAMLNEKRAWLTANVYNAEGPGNE